MAENTNVETGANSAQKTRGTGRNAIVLLPLFVVGTFSFGYLTLQTTQQPARPAIESTAQPAQKQSDAIKIEGVARPEVPTITPLEKPAPVPQAVVTGGSVTDANSQTGATSALQGAAAPTAPTQESLPNQKLQAPRNGLINLKVKSLLKK